MVPIWLQFLQVTTFGGKGVGLADSVLQQALLDSSRSSINLVSAYVDRVHFFLEANKVKEGKYSTVLLSTTETKTHTVPRNLLAPSALTISH